MTHLLRSTGLNGYVVLTLTSMGFAFFLFSCTLVSPKYNIFSENDIDQLHVGMASDEFKIIFGMPNIMYNATFGENVGEAWTGQVWLYFTERDPTFQHVKRYKKNMFVFYMSSSGRKLLNHWTIEE